LKKWNESEAYVKAVGEGYGGAHRLKWYLWCQRTGQGNLAAARDDARSFFATPAKTRDLARIGYQAVFQELEGNLPEAIAAYEQGIALRPSLRWSIHVAILAKEANDVEAINRAIAYLRKLAASAEEARTEHRQRLAALVVAELAPKADEQPASLDDMQKLLDDSPDRNTKVDLRYFLGSLLQLRGEPDEAKKYWQAAVDRGPFDRPSCTLAGFRLRQVGK
jgi:tetratricopeptide (TPR) repeat protein